MAETFYGALGVAEDADAGTIDRAYRDLVKQTHPDVSDDPDAPRRFKRLTTARDVLLDGTERARYDRLGHAAYVREHVDSSVWTTTGSTGGDNDTGTDRTDERRRGQTGAGGARSADTGTGSAGGVADSDSRSYRTYQWQRTPAWYGRSEAGREDRDQRRLLAAVRRVGPWIVIHVAFLLSALATLWTTFSQASRYAPLPLTVLVGGVALFGVVVLVSSIHILSLSVQRQ
ncbi:MAG: J domain-containing protein [Salinirussus sp.]